MTHQQILDKLAAKHLVKSIDDDLATVTFHAMCYEKDTEKQLLYILPKLLNRWNCVLNASEISNKYKQKTILALSVLIHKYGFKDDTINKRAIEAIDLLNKEVALSDDFFRKSEEIKQFILSSPAPLKRKPSIPESITFYRKGDVISIQLEDHFYAAYIHKISGANESPILEFYDGIFDKVPTWEELENLCAKGQIYNDGIERISKFSVYGLKHEPDTANQIRLIKVSVDKPANDHLEESIGLYSVIDLFKLQHEIKNLFKLSK
ncbi:hypothetical protein [Flavobacterium panici]|uniref:Uncharacterized protein n=1 Tax=Flavobacterium panici TaxID=2654843 RepID=A0A9N8P489_9FLAO|nr:hypothetical protein [Flavobacterium panici]CAC9976879.1 hypothetical protein FLAPXU55_04607 [Flavobacterium panici]